ncbi:hypothetical protein [Mycolicibacterium goodii]|uniref:Uncharacterized protein n=1 Tax=Mycolicibacterium goodii TaxID=134601 RepID=A0ABS6HYJ8_MYCGD|nr:hypothetical protein [Mycolicibacterium goodii]MBU8814340.1 hypothetical protein [Mycolicibacterium goodii]MBU8827744.1 hypothetical protein [Mycolicibacterium goodii]MBU8840762.1 hypothetical protein [Mycolicibacterium goodii]
MKWILGTVALLAVIGVTVAITVFVTGGNARVPSDQPPSADAPASGIASVNDVGPIAVLTEDPTCMAQHPIFSEWLSKIRNGWENRDPTIPAAAWTPELRTQYSEVAQAMRAAADKLESLVKLTPHRVMRELYEQWIAYARAFADSVPDYSAKDDPLAGVTITAADAIGNICAAIGYGSAAARGPLVPSLPAPSQVSSVSDTNQPRRFMLNENPVCADWFKTLKEFDADTANWRTTDPNIPSSEWSPEQRKINEDVTPVMERLTNQLLTLGQVSGDPVLRDFAEMSSQYRNAYVQALTTYTPADKHLASASIKLAGLVASACEAAAS